MRRRGARVLLLLAALQLGGCAYLAPRPGALPAQIDAWVAAQEYGKALAALDNLKPGSPHYAELKARRKAIASAADRYARRTVRQASDLVDHDQWQKAAQLYSDAFDRLPENRILRRGYAEFSALQAARLETLNLDLLIARGRWLEQALTLRRRIAQVEAGSWLASFHLFTVRRDVQKVGDQLTERGRQALAQGDIDTAARTLPLALRLHRTPEAKAANRELEKREALRRRESRVERHRKQRREVQDLRTQYDRAMADERLGEAQRLMQQMLALSPQDPELQKLNEALDSRVAAAVKRLMDEGNGLYSRGDFRQALNTWQRLLDLDPQNAQAKANIKRARRVLERLQELRSKQQ